MKREKVIVFLALMVFSIWSSSAAGATSREELFSRLHGRDSRRSIAADLPGRTFTDVYDEGTITIALDGSWTIVSEYLEHDHGTSMVSGPRFSISRAMNRPVVVFETESEHGHPLVAFFKRVPLARADSLAVANVGHHRTWLLTLVYGSLADGEVIVAVD